MTYSKIQYKMKINVNKRGYNFKINRATMVLDTRFLFKL